MARVTPLLKKVSLDPNHVENYRPVSLLTLQSKTFEKAASKQVTVKEQSHESKPVWFKSGHSTETALFSVTEALKSFRASAQSSVLILLDLSAAFDIVNHRIHLSILSSMGISGRAHSWFESYLTGRSFNVSWQAVCTSPQGCPKAWC